MKEERYSGSRKFLIVTETKRETETPTEIGTNIIAKTKAEAKTDSIRDREERQ